MRRERGGSGSRGGGGSRGTRRREESGKDVVAIVDGEVRGEFGILEEKKEGGAGGSGGKRLTSCRVLAWEPVQATR